MVGTALISQGWPALHHPGEHQLPEAGLCPQDHPKVSGMPVASLWLIGLSQCQSQAPPRGWGDNPGCSSPSNRAVVCDFLASQLGPC